MNEKLIIHPNNILIFGKPKNKVSYTFEECATVFMAEIKKRKGRWLLDRITWIDYDDVIQIIISHLYEKWEACDQSREILKWVNKIISHQTINIIRNVWGNYRSICSQCKANEGGGTCRIYGTTQNYQCPLYETWAKSQKVYKEAINLPTSFEELEETHKSQLVTYHNSFQDYNTDKLFALIQPELTTFQWKVFSWMYIDNLEDGEIVAKLGYKAGNSVRSKKLPGWKSVQKMKKLFLEKAKEVIKVNDI